MSAAPKPPQGFEPVPTAESRNWLQRNIGDPLGRGWNQLQTGANVLGGEVGFYTPREVAEGVVQNAADQAFYPVQPSIAAAQKEINDAPTAWEAIKSAASNPRAVVQTAVESLPASGAAILGGVGGAVTGGLAGPVGASAGLMAGTGAVSGATEYASTIREVLADRGIPDTIDAIEAALQNPEIMAAAREKAALRAGSVGALDAATAGLAGRIMGPVARTVGRAGAPVAVQGLAGLAGETGAQMAGGAVGEAGAQLLSEGEIKKPGAVVVEAAAEIPGAIHDVPGAMLGRHIGEKVANRNEVAPAPPPGFVPPEAPPPPAGFVPVARSDARTPGAPGEARESATPLLPPEGFEPVAPRRREDTETPAVISSAPLPPEGFEPVSAPGSRVRVSTPDGSMSVDADWHVADLGGLRRAEGDLQPRQRDTRAASDLQVNEIAAHLDPSRLVESRESDRGAPIIDENGTILSGNGRVAAIDLAMTKNSDAHAAYVQAIRDRGFDVTGMGRPVLVRRVEGLTPDQKRDFAVRSNRDGKLAMSPGEQAAVDADLISPDLLGRIDTDTDAGLGSASNAEFVRKVLSRLPSAEQAAFLDPEGRLSQQGAKRLEAAVFARAYGDRDLITRAAETDAEGGASRALLGAAPAWAAMRAEADPHFDVTPALVQAVHDVAEMRRQGVKPEAFYGQTDAFAERNPTAELLARAFYDPAGRRAAAWGSVRDFLRSYADEATRRRNAEGDLFDDAATTPEGIIRDMLDRRGARASDPRAVALDGQIGKLEASGRNPDQLAKLKATRASIDGRADAASQMRAAEDRLYDTTLSTRVPRGGLAPSFMERSTSKGLSMFEQAFRDAGLDPDRARNMPAARQIETLSTLVRDKFGLAAVRDKGAKARDAIDQMLDAYRNVQFMAHALVMPNKAIGLGGRLSISLEKASGRYLGAYAPDTRTVHMPGRSNSFAHEWAHALDHYLLGKLFDGKSQPKAYLLSQEARARGLDPSGSVEAAFANLLNVVFHDRAEFAARLAHLETVSGDTDPATGKATKAALSAQAEIHRMRAGATGPLGVPSSDYARSVADFDPASRYWLKPTEMLARAFEAYVAHKVEAVGGDNAFVTKGDAAYLDTADRRLRETFPKDETRTAIFAAFDDVMTHVRNAGLFGTDEAAPRPADTDVVDPMHWFRMSADTPATSWPQEVRQEVNRLRNAIKNPREALRAGVSETAMNAGFDRSPSVATEYPLWTRAKDAATFPVFTMRGIMKTIVARAPDGARPFVQTLTDFFATDPGTGRTIGETYEEAVTRSARRDANELAAAIRSLGFKDHLTKDQTDQLRGLLLGEPHPDAPEAMVKLAGAVRRIYDRLWRENTDAGIEQGYVKDTGYLNRVLNDQAVFDAPERFEEQASKVYSILFDKEVRDDAGAIAPDELASRIAQVKQFQPQRLEIDAFRSAMDDVRAMGRELRRLQGAATPDTKAIEALSERLAARYEDLAALVRPEWSAVSAIRWKEGILQGNEFDFATRGPDGAATRSRTLPPEADRLLEDFYVADPLQAFQIYSMNSARKREYVSRFGVPVGGESDLNHLVNANGSKNGLRDTIAANPSRYDLATPTGRARVIAELTDVRTVNRQEMLLREAMRTGMNPEDIRTFRDLAERITGRRASGAPSWLRRLSTFFYAAGSLAMMPRAMWASVTEPLTAYFQTRDAQATLKGFIAYVSEARRSAQSVKDRQALAEAIGLTTSPYFEGVIAHQMSHGYSDSVNATRLLARMYERSGLTPITNAQRRAMMVSGWLYMRKLAETIRDTGTPEARREIARAEFRDLGVSDQMMPDFVDWVSQSRDLPTLADLGTRAGSVFQVAVTRFVDQTIQEPKRVDKPALALDPIGRLAFGLSAFNYRFMRSVHFAQILRGVRDTGSYRDAGAGPVSAVARGALPVAGTLAGGFALLIAGQFLTSIVRESLLNGDKWDEMERKGELQKWLMDLALSRAGILGALDPLNQARIGLRYGRDLTNLYAGPHVAYFLGAAQGMLALAAPARENEKPKFDAYGNPKRPSNNAEWNAARSAYQVVAAPAATWLLSSIPAAGPLTGAALSYGMQKLSSPSASDAFANVLVGEKDSRKRLREREQKKALGG
ncbi:MAG: hypothetical protein OEL76_03950 [Siculibacillus sp.]|nr:hypothetical protein [Siculibacillus sp.]